LIGSWRSDHPLLTPKLGHLRRDLQRIAREVQDGALAHTSPWAKLKDWSETHLSVEGQELLVSMVIEPHGDLVDDLADSMTADEMSVFPINGSLSVGELSAAVQKIYGWALVINFDDTAQQDRFWYVSEAKLEPRLGNRREEPGAELELPLDVARAVSRLGADLGRTDPTLPLSAFLREHPEHRHVVRRTLLSARAPYAEIRDNLVSADMSPLDMLRCKLAFFGATRFDPRSDRWLRITMYQGAPFPHELHVLPEDDWVLPACVEPAL
ncbi:MAG: hypothetical protein AAFY03_10275, partial [Pseudomonadota bacterium]